MEKNEGEVFHYYCYGVATSEVEIDCLTGDHVVLRTDIVMDVGDSINPAVDIGQVLSNYLVTSHSENRPALHSILAFLSK